MKNNPDFTGIWKRIVAAIRGFCTKNLVIKVVALLFAILLWGYVLTDLKPYRTKTVTNVATSFEGEAELLAQGLCVRGDRAEILRNVTVQVRTQVTNYAALTANQINATISLRNISEPRVYELPINPTVTSGYGVVQSVSPSVATVEIDTLVRKTVPVTPVITGEVSEGYWADMDNCSITQYIDVEGPKTDIEQVRRAECVIDLSGRTSSIFSTFEVLLYDEEDNVMSSDILVGTTPSATVRIPIYPVKTVEIDAKGSLEGADTLATNHELFDVSVTPETVRLVGEQSVLDTIDSVKLDTINVSGLSELTIVKSEIIIPAGTRLLDEAGKLEDDNTVSVTVDIRESTSERAFEQMAIEVEGLGDGLSATLDVYAVDLHVEGRVSLVSILKRSDIRVLVDVTNLSAGEYDLDLFALIRDEESTVELQTSLFSGDAPVTTVHVTLRPSS